MIRIVSSSTSWTHSTHISEAMFSLHQKTKIWGRQRMFNQASWCLKPVRNG